MKHYIKLNVASPQHWYWDQNAQNWNSDPERATIFNNDQEAFIEAQRAERSGATGEVLVCVYDRKATS